ncbi:MAG: hypothetical protein QOI09_1385, partial [Chloroflexota bacterium]|nr:hypothetical protein [Chloroflexota bacterium]
MSEQARMLRWVAIGALAVAAAL